VSLVEGSEAAEAVHPEEVARRANPDPLDTLGPAAGTVPVLRDFLPSAHAAFIDPTTSRPEQLSALNRLGAEASLPNLDPTLLELAPAAPSPVGAENRSMSLWKWELHREQMERFPQAAKILDLFTKIMETNARARQLREQPQASY
jgi:hypothetical protein